jgi:predicted GNAT superfamily acetyltransferase
MNAEQITVRHCHGLAEFDKCYELQRRVWGESNIDVPMPMFVVAQETGGQMLGAFAGDASRAENMIGFTMAIAGWRDGRPFLHSHMTAVLTEFRDRGVGRKLKQFQRTDALERGIELVEWTFDPLETKNAYFNLMRLGAIARRYLPNIYGITTSPLHGGLPTDRLMAEWWLNSEKSRRLAAESDQGGAPQERRVAKSDAKTILIPDAIHDLKTKNREEALRMQAQIREQFLKWFAAGYAATEIERVEGGAQYVLERIETAAHDASGAKAVTQ